MNIPNLPTDPLDRPAADVAEWDRPGDTDLPTPATANRHHVPDLPFTGDVLFLCHPEADYGGAFLFSGLVNLLGWKRVVDWPCKWSYHGDTHNYNWHEVNGQEGYSNGVTTPLPWMGQGTTAACGDYSASDIEHDLRVGRFGCVVLESARCQTMEAWRLLGNLIRACGIPIILHDGEDYSEFNWQAIGEIGPTIYAKRELLKAVGPMTQRLQNGTLVAACPFSAPDVLLARCESEWRRARAEVAHSVAMLVGQSWPGRDDVLCGLQANLTAETLATARLGSSAPPERPLWEGGHHPLLPFWDYITALRSSRVGVSVRGHGWDTVRYWEVAATTLLLAGPLDIHIPHPYEDGASCILYGTGKDAAAAVEWCRQNPESADAIALNGWHHTRRYHTNTARARQILEYLG